MFNVVNLVKTQRYPNEVTKLSKEEGEQNSDTESRQHDEEQDQASSDASSSGTDLKIKRKKKRKGQGNGKPGAKRNVSPVRPAAVNRISLIERAGRSRTRDFVSKVTDRERQIASGKGDGTKHAERPTSPKVTAGLKILDHITEDINDMVRRIEQQKRTHDSQLETISSLTKKLEDLRDELRKSTKEAKGSSSAGRKQSSRQDAFLYKIESLQFRINEMASKAQAQRKSINEQRVSQMKNQALIESLHAEHEKLISRRDQVKAKLQAAHDENARSRGLIKGVNVTSETALVPIKDEWQALGVFAEASTERERQRLWREKKEREVEIEEEEKRQQKEDDNKKIVHMSPFAAAFEKSKSTMAAIAKQQGKQMELKQQVAKQAAAVATTRRSSSVGGKNAIVANFLGLMSGGDSNRRGSVTSPTADSSELVLAGNLTVAQEKALKTSIQAGRWQMARGQAQLQQLESRTQALEEGFELIKQKTGIEDPKEMVQIFLDREEETFRLFTHVNLLSEQIEEIEAEVESEREEIEKYRGKTEDNSNGRSIIKQLDEKLETLSKKTAVLESIGAESSQVVEKVKVSVASMFVRIGCETKLIESFCKSSCKYYSDNSSYTELIEGNQKQNQEVQGQRDQKNGEESTDQSKTSDENDEISGPKVSELEALKLEILHKAEKNKTTPPKFIMSPTSPLSPSSPASPSKRRASPKPWGRQASSIGMLGKRHVQKTPEEEAAAAAAEEALLATQRSLDITEKNLLQYIGVIEQRVSEIRQVYSIHTKQKPLEPRKDRSLKIPELPTTEGVDEDDDSDAIEDEDEIRPLFRGRGLIDTHTGLRPALD